MLTKLARLMMALVFTISLMVYPVYAGKTASVSIGFIGNSKIAHVTINDNNVITIKANKNINPLTETKQIAQRLNKLLYNRQLRADRILPAIRGNNYIARVDRDVIFTVDKNMARSENSNVSSVTIKWINNLRGALGGKPLGYQVSRSLASRSTSNTQYGYASWYGGNFQGSRTSSGEPYDMARFTAAHRTLPLGTPVLVTNLSTGRSVLVKINDRGPFSDTKNRILDLSSSAFKAIASLNSGVIRIKIDVMR